LRIYLIARDYQGAEIDTADAARRFMAWLADAANPVLAEVIQTWLCQPPDAGGLGAVAGSGRDVAALRAAVSALWPPAHPSARPGGGETR
jgi:hypothetical protein